ncbi:MAG: GlcG/HbpS family heme-binding protein [Anaerocolumna sp.]
MKDLMNQNTMNDVKDFTKIKELTRHLLQIKQSSKDDKLVHSLALLHDQLNKIQVDMVSNMVRSSVCEYLKDTYQLIETHRIQNENISLKIATALIKEIELKAVSMGVHAVIAVYNKGANPVAVHVMDDAYIASYDIACNKAYTCAALKMSTLTLKALSQPGGSLYGIQNTNQGKIVIFGGGEPLYNKDKLIGALGVSGGSEEQDSELAEFGKIKLKEVMVW